MESTAYYVDNNNINVIDALKQAKEQTPEICIADVNQYESALTYIHKQTYNIYMAAVKKDKHVLIYVKNKASVLCSISGE